MKVARVLHTTINMENPNSSPNNYMERTKRRTLMSLDCCPLAMKRRAGDSKKSFNVDLEATVPSFQHLSQ